MQLLLHLYQAYLKRKYLYLFSHSLWCLSDIGKAERNSYLIFFLWKCKYTCEKITRFTCKYFTKLRLLYHKVRPIIILYFRPSPQIL